MGGTSWNDDHYDDRARVRSATNTPAFKHDHDVRSGIVAAKIHDSLDPKNIKGVRESRDSDEHPESNAVAVLFDQTGSMGQVPRTVQANLKTLMALLLRKSYLTDPAILVGAIGDVITDQAVLQVGQFESGIEIENDLTNLWLEGNGGGQKHESYELALYFLARKTAMDCFEKRQKRGYAFIIGDEMTRDPVRKVDVSRIFGDSIEADIPLGQIIKEVQDKFELFYILPQLTSYYDDPEVNKFWKTLLNERFIKLDDPAGVSELIASQIGVCENAVDIDTVVADLVGTGTAKATANSVVKSLVPVDNGGSLLPNSGRGTGLASV